MKLFLSLCYTWATNLCILHYLNFKMSKFPGKRKAPKN